MFKYLGALFIYTMQDPLLAPAQSVSVFLFGVVMLVVIYILWKILGSK